MQCQRARQTDAALTGSPELHGHRVVIHLDTDLGKQLPRRVTCDAPRAVVMLEQWQLHILDDTDASEERRALEEHANARPQPAEGVVVRLRWIEGLPIDSDRSFGRALQPD